METGRSFILPWAYCSQDKAAEQLGCCLFCNSLELENTQLRALLERADMERDEARDRYQKVLLENLLLQQQLRVAVPAATAPPISGVSSFEDDELKRRGEKDSSNTFNGGFSSSDGEDSIVSSPIVDGFQALPRSLDSLLETNKALPEKGKLLQAVVKAGPLLETLLLAGPLPQWQHPPPLLGSSSEIPPVKVLSQPPRPVIRRDTLLMNTNSSMKNNTMTVCGTVSYKRRLPEGLFDFPTETKYQKVALP
ncbi:hypothetical protein SAY87_016617 [Trapa incisa]|uniref:Uncharacterized protein n=1 Tax=Trapa incisa TaxID=236973 RepID=A0AAN7QXM7_9MYRT|nr:hypothetical protein SAY87_016617 [Trapa incisa]